ncbi:MAG: hypothetical protein LBF38_07825 [Deltaproteobacteria bacterium]|jgi:hypothetical protein|nr:hypothetical protein [Deltaproteobacteria bacterium]
MPYVYSGVCLAAMFGSIIYEHHRLKKEERELCELMKNLAEQTKSEFGLVKAREIDDTPTHEA